MSKALPILMKVPKQRNRRTSFLTTSSLQYLSEGPCTLNTAPEVAVTLQFVFWWHCFCKGFNIVLVLTVIQRIFVSYQLTTWFNILVLWKVLFAVIILNYREIIGRGLPIGARVGKQVWRGLTVVSNPYTSQYKNFVFTRDGLLITFVYSNRLNKI